MRLKLVGIVPRNRPRKPPDTDTKKSIAVIIKQIVVKLHTEFRYDRSSNERHFPEANSGSLWAVVA